MPSYSFYQKLQYCTRSLGLDAISFSYRRLFFKSKVEEKKVVINSSVWAAFAQCLVHFIPVTVSTYLIVLNLRGHYIGENLSGAGASDTTTLGFIQIAAKIQVREF